MIHDLSERRYAEDALALSRHQLAEAMTLARLANWEYDVADGLYTFDDRFFALYGTSVHREGGNRMSPETYTREFLFPEDARLVFDGIQRLLSSADPAYILQAEHRVRRRDGETRHLFVRVVPLKDATGRTVKLRGVSQDITERKHAEQRLSEALELNRTLIAASTVGIAVFKASGECVLTNEALSQISGGSIDQFLHLNFRHVDSWRANGLLGHAETALRLLQPRQVDLFNTVTIFGRRVAISARFVPFMSNDELHLLVMVTNLTERQRLERQILEVSDREQARIGQDIHDGLCQHLVSLAFDANALHRALKSQARPETPTADRIAAHLDQAITEARQLSRGLFPIRLEAEGLSSALEELARSTQQRSQIHCAFESEAPVKIPTQAMATHLFRIAQEAVTNAVKHGQPHAISIQLNATASHIELRVKDDGIGLPSGILEQSVGMGLHIMDYRARSVGGSFRAGSGSHGGTEIFCCVPRQPR